MKASYLWTSILLVSGVYAKDHGPLQVHILEEGETFSDLLYNNDFKPLYGKNNWVQKTLELNHMTMEQAKKIKKGYPIILPTREIVQDEIILQKAAVSHTGLVGGRISDQVNAFLEFGYFYQSANINSKSVNLQENYHLGFHLESSQRHEIANGMYTRPHINLSYESQNTLAFSNNSDVEASFAPTYNLKLGAITDYNLPFGILTQVALNQSSRLYEDSKEELVIRRDSRAEAIVGISKTWESGRMVYNLTPYIGHSIWSKNNDNYSNDSVLTMGLEGKLNFTQDSNLKAYVKNNSYNTDDQITVMGINWDYQIK